MKEFIKISIGLVFVIYCSLTIFAQNDDLALTGDDVVCAGSSTFHAMSEPLSGDYPSDWYSTISKKYAWGAEDGVVSFPGTTTFEENNTGTWIDWDNTCDDGKVIAKFKLTYLDTGVIQEEKTKIYTEELIVQIKQPVTSVTISGETSVPCDASGPYTYSASGCAESYNWILPSGWAITPGEEHKKTITVYPSASTGGTITVEAVNSACFSAPGSVTASITVLRECIENKFYGAPTSSLPAHTPVNNTIVAGAIVLGGWVEVLSGQSVRFRAGNKITLTPKFRSLTGSFFNAKIGPCTDCFAYRIVGGNADEDSTTINQTFSANNDDNIFVYPNPSMDGKFNIEMPENSVGTNIEVFNLKGEVIYFIQPTGNTKITFDISDQPKGIYLVRAVNGNKSFSKKIIYE